MFHPVSCASKLLFRPLTQLAKMSKSTVAVCQLTSTDDKEENLKIVKELVEDAARKNAKVVFLPEACDFISRSTEDVFKLAEKLDGNLMNEYKTLAKRLNIWISIGGFHELIEGKDRVRNAHVLINDQGEIQSIYRKAHLYDVVMPERNINLQESRYVEKGTEIVPPVETPIGFVSLSICYDLRFPELSTILRKMNADILTYPSAFTHKTGKAHWEVLLRSRAIENQCYVIAAAQYGQHNEKRICHGQAMIVDPWGEIIAQCPAYNEEVPRSNCLVIANIDKEFIEKVRGEMPLLQHRRNDLYQLSAPLVEYPDDKKIYKFSNNDIEGSTVFYKTKLSYAFTNIRCVVPGHVLVAPIRLACRLQDLTEEEMNDIIQMIVKVQNVMEKIYSTRSSTICIQDGVDAGQTVQHLHCHILPRKPNDFPDNDDVYTELARHDKEASKTPLRSLQERAEEATLLRKYFYGPN